MKESCFNLYFKAPDGTRLAFNSLSCALAIVDDTYSELISILQQKIPERLADVFEAAKQGNFVVCEDKDEVLDYLTKREMQIFSPFSLGLTIAPTLDCNLRCTYCYETRKKGKMSLTTQDNIVRFVKSRVKELKNVDVTWYGGEPLLCVDIIKSLSENLNRICMEEGVQYRAFIITNGLLLTPEIAGELKACKIVGVQITLDGPKTIHESRRITANGKESFDQILGNVNMCLKNGFDVALRVNIDKNNEGAVEELITELSKRLISKNLKISFGQVSAYTEACCGIQSTCYDNAEFAIKILEYYKVLEDYGFGVLNKFPYPFVKFNYCGAEKLLSFVIDPDGALYKCWNEVGNTNVAVGNINEAGIDVANDKCGRWVSRTLPDSCKACPILPICAGGCPHVTTFLGKPNACDYIKYNIEATMVEYYQKFM